MLRCGPDGAHMPRPPCYPSQVAPEHDRLASELLSILVSAGYLAPADAAGRFTATADVSSADTQAQLGRLKDTADELASSIVPDLATNVELIWVCMQALPQILTGERSYTAYRAQLQYHLYVSHLELEA